MFHSHTQIDKKLMQAGSMVARVRNEVEIQSRLKHPAILELYNYFEDSNYVYLVLEMCHNGELSRYLRTTRKRLTEEEGNIHVGVCHQWRLNSPSLSSTQRGVCLLKWLKDSSIFIHTTSSIETSPSPTCCSQPVWML